MSTKTLASVLIAVFGSVLFTPTASGFPLTLSLDPAMSSLTLSGDAGGIPLQKQGAGSLITSYFGTVSVEVDNPTAPTSIQFLSAAATAGISGNWVPNNVLGPGAGQNQPGNEGDPAPANYGAVAISILGGAAAAVRDLEFTINSAAIPIVGGDFNSSQTFDVAAGISDTNVKPTLSADTAASDPIASNPLVNAAAKGSYSVTGNIATLIIPVAVTIVDPAFTLTFNGTLRGSGPIFGDMNGDLSVDAVDAGLLIEALVDRSAYDARGFGVNADLKGDVDQSGTFDLGDVAAFSALLGGPASAETVPEPDPVSLLAIALVFAMLFGPGRRQRIFAFPTGCPESCPKARRSPA